MSKNNIDPVQAFNNAAKNKKNIGKKKENNTEENVVPPISQRIDVCMGLDHDHCEKDIAGDLEKIHTLTKKISSTPQKRKDNMPEVSVPKPEVHKKINITLKIPSVQTTSDSVKPIDASPDSSQVFVEKQDSEDLVLHQPKSGIILNETKKNDNEKIPAKRTIKRNNKPNKHHKTHHEKLNKYDGTGTVANSGHLTKQLLEKVSMISKSTSYRTEIIPTTTKLESKLDLALSEYLKHHDKHKRKKRKLIQGTLENHSLTELKYEQPTLKTNYFGVKEGSLHQADPRISNEIRDKQGLCMPVAAYCYAILKNPNKWRSKDIDNIIGIGNDLYLESLKAINDNSNGDKIKKSLDLSPNKLQKYCYINSNKIRFVVDEPEVTGLINSDDKRIFNLAKGLKIFFSRYKAGILKSTAVDLAIWKDKHYYLFDARPRTRDMFSDENGTAVLAHIYDISSIIYILLERSNYENWPFAIYPIRVSKVLKIGENSETDLANDVAYYNIVDDCKAVVMGSFELGDECFASSRNKQALAIATIGLVYSRITPPSTWTRMILDKILTIGNQLYGETVKINFPNELVLTNLPAMFTIGPYFVEIYVYPNLKSDVLYKNSKCLLMCGLQEFFKTNSNAILQIDSKYLAVWTQRNMFFCLDPYSRNNEALPCRKGTSCVSMHCNLDSLVGLLQNNFDSFYSVFHLHALKVCKIHRDPTQSERFPHHFTMDDFSLECVQNHKMVRSKKAATSKPVTVYGTNGLFDGDPARPSLVEVGSNVDSLLMKLNVCDKPNAGVLVTTLPTIDEDVVVDLDRPSLSDTQVAPPLPQQPTGPEEVEFMNLDSYDLTLEELELQEVDSGENYLLEDFEMDDPRSGYEVEKKESELNLKKVGTDISKRKYFNQTVNTEITFLPITREVLHPTNLGSTKKFKDLISKRKNSKELMDINLDPVQVTLSQELARETNFTELPDGSQVINGTVNMTDFGEDIEFMAPFVSIMAAIISRKYSIYSWNPDVVDYIIKCGAQLYQSSKVRFDQVPKLEYPCITINKNKFEVVVEYVFDAFIKPKVLDQILEKILFVRSNMGVLVTPTYSCAIIKKDHFFYMFDGFANTKVGLIKDMSRADSPCVTRFRNLSDLVARIMFNKSQREIQTGLVYSRFVLSAVRVKSIDFRKQDKNLEEKTTDDEDILEKQYGEYSEIQDDDKINEEEQQKDTSKQPILVGYQNKNGSYVIEGSTELQNRHLTSVVLREDHFVCLCACLTLMTVPVKNWDTKKVDEALKNGIHVFSHADDLEVSDKRTISNVLIEKHFFDLIIKRVRFASKRLDKDLFTGIDSLLTKKLMYFMVQFPSACYVVHRSADNFFHLFDCYGIHTKDQGDCHAGWMRFKDLEHLKLQLKNLHSSDYGVYMFFTFEVTSIRKASKDVVMTHQLYQYELEKRRKQEIFDETFYEDVAWLKGPYIPWTRKLTTSASGVLRGSLDNMWHNWDIEYPQDLFSMMGNINQLSNKFSDKSRGKQTICNLVVAIGMLEIYNLSEWNASVIDSVLVNGDNYFLECTENIKTEDYEMAFTDLKEHCTIFPYGFRVEVTAAVEGTMFLVRPRQLNLYKALRVFIRSKKKCMGLMNVVKGERHKQVAFGKVDENEYFMFDVDAVGVEMFAEKVGFPYILRMTSFNRLVHVLTLTLQGGEFFIFNVDIKDLSPIN